MLTGIHHYVQAVQDLEKTVDDWCRLLDIPRPEIKPDPRGHRYAIIHLGDSPVYLCQSPTPDGPFAKFVAQRGEGMYSVALEESDMKGAVARLKGKGVQTIPTTEPSGVTLHLIPPKATNGFMWELCPKHDIGKPPSGGFVKRVQFVCHAVKDLEPTLATYADLLGLKPDSKGIAPGPGPGIRSAWLPIGQDSIGILSPVAPEGPIVRFLDRTGGGLYNLMMKVNDMKGTVEKLNAKGVRTIPGGPRAVWLHPAGTHGVLIEMQDAAEAGH